MAVSGACPLAVKMTYIRGPRHLELLLHSNSSPHDSSTYLTVLHVTAGIASDGFPGSVMCWAAEVVAWFQHTLPNTFPTAVWLVPLIVFLGIMMLDKLPEPVPKGSTVYSFDYYKDLYRTRRDAFRANPAGNGELKHWKAQDNDFKYNEM